MSNAVAAKIVKMVFHFNSKHPSIGKRLQQECPVKPNQTPVTHAVYYTVVIAWQHRLFACVMHHSVRLLKWCVTFCGIHPWDTLEPGKGSSNIPSNFSSLYFKQWCSQHDNNEHQWHNNRFCWFGQLFSNVCSFKPPFISKLMIIFISEVCCWKLVWSVWNTYMHVWTGWCD